MGVRKHQLFDGKAVPPCLAVGTESRRSKRGALKDLVRQLKEVRLLRVRLDEARAVLAKRIKHTEVALLDRQGNR